MSEILKNIPLFSELDSSQFNQLQNITTIQKYKNGEVFFEKGELIKKILILVDGIACIYKKDKKGNEIVIGYFHRYAILSESPAFMGEGASSFGKFKSDGALIKIDLESFKKNFMPLPHISEGIIESLLTKIRLLQQNIHLNMNTTAKEKIEYFYKNHHALSLDLKKYEIASILGISAETYSRNVKALVNEKKLLTSTTGYKWKKIMTTNN